MTKNNKRKILCIVIIVLALGVVGGIACKLIREHSKTKNLLLYLEIYSIETPDRYDTEEGKEEFYAYLARSFAENGYDGYEAEESFYLCDSNWKKGETGAYWVEYPLDAAYRILKVKEYGVGAYLEDVIKEKNLPDIFETREEAVAYYEALLEENLIGGNKGYSIENPITYANQVDLILSREDFSGIKKFLDWIVGR